MLALLLLAACAPEGGEAADLAEVEEGEWLPGGETTNTLMLGSNAFIMPAANLDPETEAAFYSGNGFFNQSWVEAPASTDARDGLGPLFNARSCSGCHFKDGRGRPPADDTDLTLGLLLRLSVPDTGHPDPVYGGQLQDAALPGVPAEGRISVSWSEEPGSYPDGTAYSLRRPAFSVADLGYGPLDPGTLLGPRVAPHVVGLGLLEAIDPLDHADPDDADGDGISGRVNLAWDPSTGDYGIGRFGWKAEQTSVMNQSAGAFAGDMGLTSALFATDDCTDAQGDCLDAASGGSPEITDPIMDRTGTYTATVAVPVRRDWDAEPVLRGKKLFGDMGCAGCHVPSWETGDHEIAALAGQHIWPYTDLLLHDMGEDLADGLSVYDAGGSEWRTPPLWGLGLLPDVSGHLELLHDGRARGFAEAILWHGGEGEGARDAFADLHAGDRDAVVSFLESL